MNKFASTLAITALLSPLTALAHNYSYIEGGYLGRDYGQEEASGFRIAGSGDIHQNFALFGEYSNVEEVDQITAGLMFHTPLNEVLDLNLGASFEHIDVGFDDDAGYGLRAGVRWQMLSRLEMNPEVRYIDAFDSQDTALRLNGLYAFTRELDLQAALQGGDDDRVEVGLRWNFGPRIAGR